MLSDVMDSPLFKLAIYFNFFICQCAGISPSQLTSAFAEAPADKPLGLSLTVGSMPRVTAWFIIVVRSSLRSSISFCLLVISLSICAVFSSKKLAMVVCSGLGGITNGIFDIILFINLGFISSLTENLVPKFKKYGRNFN